MATTVHKDPAIDGGWHDRPPSHGGRHAVHDSSPASRTGVWVGLVAITMTFVSLTSAMIVREGTSNDWRHFTLPPILYFNTLLLLGSSVTLELARKRAAAFVAGERSERSATLLLWITMGLGWLFVVGQCLAWRQLRREGLYLATNPSSSFFYLFTVLHALHVVGGLAALAMVLWRISKAVPTLRVSTLSAVSYYWHYMSALWIYLLLLLWTGI